MYKAVSPLQAMFNMAGMKLPKYLKGENVEGVTEESKPVIDTSLDEPKE